MKYSKGKIGRVFLVKFDNEDVLIDEIKRLCKKEKIKTASFMFLGALKQGDIVTGPKKAVIPPDPNWRKFEDGWEVMGIGSIFANKKNEPQIHVHGSMGKADNVITGCVRGDAKVFIVIEAVILELKGVKAVKDIDPATTLNMLKILSK